MKQDTDFYIEILNKKETFHNNRGKTLETDINISNQYYIDTKQAFIYKKPTPIKILKVDYPSKTNKTGKITIKFFIEGDVVDKGALRTSIISTTNIEEVHLAQ